MSLDIKASIIWQVLLLRGGKFLYMKSKPASKTPLLKSFIMYLHLKSFLICENTFCGVCCEETTRWRVWDMIKCQPLNKTFITSWTCGQRVCFWGQILLTQLIYVNYSCFSLASIFETDPNSGSLPKSNYLFIIPLHTPKPIYCCLLSLGHNAFNQIWPILVEYKQTYKHKLL